MKKCDRCGGSGLAMMGVFSMTADCPDCGGSGWVDPKVQGPPPERKPARAADDLAPSPAPVAREFKPRRKR